jgi:DNA-directed RNA polymerase subunit RPC12/RpoP
MGEVINIEANIPHIVAELICVKCGKRWIGVWPETTPLRDLECENC